MAAHAGRGSRGHQEAWGYISPEDLEEATAAGGAVAHRRQLQLPAMAVENALQALINSGASEAEIDAFQRPIRTVRIEAAPRR